MNTATKVGTSKYGKKVIDTIKKEGSEFAKIAGKKVVQRGTEATGDLIGNKVANKITSLGKSKNKEKENETNEEEEIIIPVEKRQQIINGLTYFLLRSSSYSPQIRQSPPCISVYHCCSQFPYII